MNTHTASLRSIVLPTCDDEVSGSVQTGPELDVQTSQASCVQSTLCVKPAEDEDDDNEYGISSSKMSNADDE